MTTTISWTPHMLDRFQQAFDAAEQLKLESFMFDDNEFVTAYAKYLIEHLNNVLHGANIRCVNCDD